MTTVRRQRGAHPLPRMPGQFIESLRHAGLGPRGGRAAKPGSARRDGSRRPARCWARSTIARPKARRKSPWPSMRSPQAEAENDVDIRFNQAQPGVAKKWSTDSTRGQRQAEKAKPKVGNGKASAWNGRRPIWPSSRPSSSRRPTSLTAGRQGGRGRSRRKRHQRRKIVAPLSGEVIEIYARRWRVASPGVADPAHRADGQAARRREPEASRTLVPIRSPTDR